MSSESLSNTVPDINLSHRLQFRKIIPQSFGNREACVSAVFNSLRGLFLKNNPMYPVCLRMKMIEGLLMFQENINRYTARDTHRKAGNVYDGSKFVPGEITDYSDEVIL